MKAGIGMVEANLRARRAFWGLVLALAAAWLIGIAGCLMISTSS
jgi:hypothetical protein